MGVRKEVEVKEIRFCDICAKDKIESIFGLSKCIECGGDVCDMHSIKIIVPRSGNSCAIQYAICTECSKNHALIKLCKKVC